jgi:Domain of unknown function (DUF4148)
MKNSLSIVLLASAGIVSNGSAQEKTRAQARQELIQAEVDGSGFVTDASYPDIAPGLWATGFPIEAAIRKRDGDCDVWFERGWST